MWRSFAARVWRLVGKQFRWVAGVATVVGVAIALWGRNPRAVRDFVSDGWT